MENTIDKFVTNYLLFRDKGRLKGNLIGPSEISSSCVRQVCLGRSQEAADNAIDETFKGISARIEGSALHEYFQNHVFTETAGVEIIEAEKFIKSEFMNGYIDGIIRFDDGHKALLEIKTVNGLKYEKMKTSGKPQPEYIEQLTLYMGHEGIHEGYVFVINRALFDRENAMQRAITPIGTDNGMFMSFQVEFKQELYEELVKRAETLYHKIEEFKQYGVLPDKPGNATPNGFPCLWCKFNQYCWADMYKEVPAGSLDDKTKEELLALWENHMRLRQRAASLNTQLEDSEKKINKFFRENGKKGFSSIAGTNFVIGTDGNLFIYPLGRPPVKAVPLEGVPVKRIKPLTNQDSELIVVEPVKDSTDTQMTLEESMKEPVETVVISTVDVSNNKTDIIEQKEQKKKRGRPKKMKETETEMQEIPQQEDFMKEIGAICNQMAI